MTTSVDVVGDGGITTTWRCDYDGHRLLGGRSPSNLNWDDKNVQSAMDEGHPDILSRTTDESLIRGNRAAACRGFCGSGSPDEYPFASTEQGGAGARVEGVPIGEQRIQGGVLSSFYQKYAIGDGDLFRVVVRGLE